MNNYGSGHEVISIWNATHNECDDLFTNNNHFQIEQSELPTEHIFIYQKNKLNQDGSQNLLHQFNLDFDRERISLNGTQCTTRLSFLKFLMPYLSQTNQLDHILLLCQQTIFAYILKDLLDLLKANRLDYLIIDSGESVHINIKEIPEKQDIQLKANKKLLLIDPIDTDLILNTINIEIISESLFDPLIYIYTNFQFKI